MGHSNILERYQFFFPIGSAVLRKVQLNLTTTVTLGTEKSGHCVERLKQESMYGLSAQKKLPLEVGGTGGGGGWPLVERWSLVVFRLYPHHTLYAWKLKLCYTNALRLCQEDYFAPCCMLPIDSPSVSFNF